LVWLGKLKRVLIIKGYFRDLREERKMGCKKKKRK
jgi:hypothetical protein